jgi:NCAIR mutase (PurE)-related protein
MVSGLAGEIGMERAEIERILAAVRDRRLTVAAALERLRLAPLERMEGITLDLHRALRRGFPEVVYGAAKTPDQVAAIVRRLREARQRVLVTRADPEAFAAVRAIDARARYHAAARAIVVGSMPARARPGILVVTAGTSDVPVAEEAALTAELMGNVVERIHDVGVAGLHRLLAHGRALARAHVVVAVAGMEGALPSVVAGLTDCPVIGVPTSTGYGAGRPGEAALLAMLHSCAGGLTVVNIDNGFGAGLAAGLINRRAARRPRTRSKGPATR